MKKDKIHFIGIGGAGMSGIAGAFHCRGYKVQGSDVKKTKVTDRLEDMGVLIQESHSAKNVEGVDYVVYSSCIKEDNPEYKEALSKNIPILKRIEALNMLLESKKLVAVSGAHGKTTTTSLITYLLSEGGLDPTAFIGADVDFLSGNACYGKGDIVVTEADESDGSFLLLNPLYSVVTNIDKEHMDYYSNMRNVVTSYKEFMDNTKEEGCSFVCIDDNNLREIIKDSPRKILKYGFSQDADMKAENVEFLGLNGSSFDLIFKNKKLGRINLSLMGSHNVLNSLGAIAVAMHLGLDFSCIKKAIANFKGAERRFVISHLASDVLLIDDYAHHPTEIKATMGVLENSKRRIIAIFQPHRYSRTKFLKEEFGSCFELADHVVITDIYSAYEEPIDKVSAKDICESAKEHGHKNVNFVPKNDIIGHLKGIVKPKDVIFILGAGDIGELPEKIIETFENIKIV